MKNLFKALVAVCAMWMASGVSATVILNVNANGTLVGAQNVEVNGTLYDVTFSDASCFYTFSGCNEPSDFVFDDASSALAASTALLNHVFVDGAAGNFDTGPFAIDSIGSCDYDQCNAYTPYALITSGSVHAAVAANFDATNTNTDYSVSGITYSTTLSFSADAAQQWAVWTVSVAPVSEPTTTALLALGLLGAGLSVRRRRQRQSH